jgi:hypothetical protein
MRRSSRLHRIGTHGDLANWVECWDFWDKPKDGCIRFCPHPSDLKHENQFMIPIEVVDSLSDSELQNLIEVKCVQVLLGGEAC